MVQYRHLGLRFLAHPAFHRRRDRLEVLAFLKYLLEVTWPSERRRAWHTYGSSTRACAAGTASFAGHAVIISAAVEKPVEFVAVFAVASPNWGRERADPIGTSGMSWQGLPIESLYGRRILASMLKDCVPPHNAISSRNFSVGSLAPAPAGGTESRDLCPRLSWGQTPRLSRMCPSMALRLTVPAAQNANVCLIVMCRGEL